MLPALLASIGLPLLVKAVQEGLNKIDSPVAKAASNALDGVNTAITTGAIPLDQVKEANRHLEAIATLDSSENMTALTQINESLRTEVASEDPYVRRMRPTFGYIMAATWGAQMFAIAYTIVTDPKSAGAVMDGMSSLSAIWSVGLAVLGIYVYKRSNEKSALSQPGKIITKDDIIWN